MKEFLWHSQHLPKRCGVAVRSILTFPSPYSLLDIEPYWQNYHTVHSALNTTQRTLNTIHRTLHTVHCTIHALHKTIHTARRTQPTVHYPLFTTQCTCTKQSHIGWLGGGSGRSHHIYKYRHTPNIAHWTLHTTYCTLNIDHCTLNNVLHIAHCTPHTAHCI